MPLGVPRHVARWAGIERDMIYQQLINGLMLGASYALIAIGSTSPTAKYSWSAPSWGSIS
jgi:hypothetical protein